MVRNDIERDAALFQFSPNTDWEIIENAAKDYGFSKAGTIEDLLDLYLSHKDQEDPFHIPHDVRIYAVGTSWDGRRDDFCRIPYLLSSAGRMILSLCDKKTGTWNVKRLPLFLFFK